MTAAAEATKENPNATAAATPLLHVENLRVSFGDAEVVKGISFTAQAGRCLAIVGESGSGKSVTARTIVGLTGPGSHVSAERIDLAGLDLTRQSERSWRAIRGREIGFILQDALVSLDQLRLVGDEIAEPLKLHGWGTRASRRERAIELLGSVGVPEPEVKVRQRPYELSGGLRQRALIASAIALDPRLLVADEPTTALDVTIQAQVLDLLAESKAGGSSIILISHDLSVVARLADEVIVMRGGEVLEQGPAGQVLHQPRHEYTQALLDAIPSEHTRGTRLVRTAESESGAQRTRHPIDRGRPVLEARHLDQDVPRAGQGRPDRRGRRVVPAFQGRDPRHRRRVWLGQDHDRADCARPAPANLRRGAAARAAVVGAAAVTAQAAAHADRRRLPGPAELLRPALARRPDHHRRAPHGQPAAVVTGRGTSPRHPAARAGRAGRAASGRPRRCACPAGSGSASPSPGRWRRSRR